MNADQGASPPTWQSQVLPTLKQFDIRHIAYVPDAGHAPT